MLQHFHAGDDVVVLRLLHCEFLDRHLAVFHRESAFQQMQLRDLEPPVAHVYAGYLGATRRHGLGKDAAAAAHIQHRLAIEPRQPVDVVEPQGVDVVQRLELAVGVPPAMRELVEFFEFERIDVAHGRIKFLKVVRPICVNAILPPFSTVNADPCAAACLLRPAGCRAPRRG